MSNCLLFMPLKNDIIITTNMPEAAMESEDIPDFDF